MEEEHSVLLYWRQLAICAGHCIDTEGVCIFAATTPHCCARDPFPIAAQHNGSCIQPASVCMYTRTVGVPFLISYRTPVSSALSLPVYSAAVRQRSPHCQHAQCAVEVHAVRNAARATRCFKVVRRLQKMQTTPTAHGLHEKNSYIGYISVMRRLTFYLLQCTYCMRSRCSVAAYFAAIKTQRTVSKSFHNNFPGPLSISPRRRSAARSQHTTLIAPPEPLTFALRKCPLLTLLQPTARVRWPSLLCCLRLCCSSRRQHRRSRPFAASLSEASSAVDVLARLRAGISAVARLVRVGASCAVRLAVRHGGLRNVAVWALFASLNALNVTCVAVDAPVGSVLGNRSKVWSLLITGNASG